MASLGNFSAMFSNSSFTTLGAGANGDKELSWAQASDLEEYISGSKMPKTVWFSEEAKNDKVMQNKIMILKIISDAAWSEAINEIQKKAQELSESDNGFMSTVGKGVDAITGGAKKAADSEIVKPYKDLIKEKFPAENYEHIMVLPLPNNFSDTDTQSYEDAEVFGRDSGNAFDNMGLGSLKDVLVNTYEKTLKSGADMMDMVAQAINAQRRRDARREKVIGQMPILNPHAWQKWKGSDFKEFSFDFTFVPRSKSEAQTMCQMVYLLKKYSYGQLNANGFAVSAPPKVLITFQNPIIQKLVNPGICVLSEVQTKFGDGNSIGVTLDGVPRVIEVQIRLKEYTVRFRDDFL